MATIDLGRLRFAWQGAWDNATVYEQNDVVTYSDGIYVGIASTIAANTLPTDTGSWALMIDVAGFATSSDITTAINNLVDSAPGALDTLNELAAALGDDADFATTVTNNLAGKADTSHTHAISDVTNLQTELDGKAPLAQPLNAQSANYTLQSSDTSAVIKASGTITITVPDAVFSAGERVDVVNTGTGVITFAEGSGVTLLSKDSAVTIDTQYAAASIIFDSASQAFLIGDLA